MSKFRSSILILGSIALCVVVALATFITLSATGMLVTDPIRLTFTVSDAYKTYDGEPLKADTYFLTEGELLEGHKEVVTFLGEQIAVGEGESSISVKIVDEKGFDVSKNYAVRVYGGLLTVDPRSVAVRQTDVEAEYSGEPIFGERYDVTTGTLLVGHKLVATAASGGLIDVGVGSTVSVRPSVFDAVGNDVTDNYAIDFTAGTVTVKPRKIVLQPLDVEKVYDGKPLAPQYTLKDGALPEGHTLEVEYGVLEGNSFTQLETITDAQTIENVAVRPLRVTTERDGETKDVTDNFSFGENDLTCSWTVNPQTLAVRLKDCKSEYTGAPIALTTNEVLQTELSAEIRAMLMVTSDRTAVDVGTYSLSVAWAATDDAQAYGRNHRLDVSGGSLTVDPMTITVTLTDAEKPYTGENIDLSLTDLGVSITPTGVSTDILEIDAPMICNAGRYSLSVRLRDGVHNYKIGNNPRATVTVTRKFVTVTYNTTNTIDKMYDGLPPELDFTKFTVSDGYTVTSARLVAVDVGYAVTDLVIKKGGVDITDNLQFDTPTVTVNYTQCFVQIYVADFTLPEPSSIVAVTDEKLRKYVCVSTATPLVNGDYIVLNNITFEKTFDNASGVGTVSIVEDSLKIYNSKGDNVTDRYAITFDSGRVSMAI